MFRISRRYRKTCNTTQLKSTTTHITHTVCMYKYVIGVCSVFYLFFWSVGRVCFLPYEIAHVTVEEQEKPLVCSDKDALRRISCEQRDTPRTFDNERNSSLNDCITISSSLFSLSPSWYLLKSSEN